ENKRQAEYRARTDDLERSLPPPGHPRRLERMHALARKYLDRKSYRDACRIYDLIAEEGGTSAIAEKAERPYAARAYLACARQAHGAVALEKAKRWLARSALYARPTPQHLALQRKIARDEYRKKMVNGDAEGALKLFNAAQQNDANEDERIWMGEQLAAMAWAAHESGDKQATKDLLQKLEDVAPMNHEYRRLKGIIDDQANVFMNIVRIGGAVIAAVLLWNLLAIWRARARLNVKKNRYEVD
ncbi:MAG: hypothetical protein AAFV29_26570, partial [Myxococcota bacterium]